MLKKTHAWRSSCVNHNSLLWFYTMALFILYAFSFSRMLFKFLITLLTTTFLRTSASIPLWESSRVLDDENIYHVKYMASATPTIKFVIVSMYKGSWASLSYRSKKWLFLKIRPYDVPLDKSFELLIHNNVFVSF